MTKELIRFAINEAAVLLGETYIIVLCVCAPIVLREIFRRLDALERKKEREDEKDG